MRALRSIGALTAVVMLSLTPVVPATADSGSGHGGGHGPSPVLRQTTLGPVAGVDERQDNGTYSWLGIPYAEPPVADLRWKPPVTHAGWRAPLATDEYGQGCAQPGRFFSPSPDGPHYDLDVRDGLGEPVGEEDCLRVNVHRPATAKKNLPVVVFVHGGSNVVGYSADPMYDGRTLAEQTESVVVTVNYRLGLFGWLDLARHDTGEPEADSGNFGLLDQIEALRFVRDNARVFGGNPRNVTIMGESAGAVNVWGLMVSPLARGLYDKAIPMSGGLSTTTPEDARAYADGLASAAAEDAGLDGVEEGARLMEQMSDDDLIRLALRHGLDATPAVIADGTVIPDDPYAALGDGSNRNVPVLAGNTLEEGKLFGATIGAHPQSDYDRFTTQYEFDPNEPSPWGVEDFIDERYLPVDAPGGWNEESDALTDQVFMGIAEESMTTLQESGNRNVYYYQFAWDDQPEPFDEVYGSAHALDLPFVFGNFERNVFSYAFSRANEPGRLDLSDQMIGAVGRFVRTGDPQTGRLPVRWRQWPNSVVFDADHHRARITTGSFS
ncbi:carboxylesterase/lipase family protein [Nocardiopsis sp. JB363]|uniref:carboxylesterase/lipase family protein n=1 Tax=Nocardiopsis sp. JB363 TaxID=1434837 RepID=UPI000979D377|nr:carboxylesterase family protein [Nocardiopsis sp. JB363]SIO87884.1 putative esterase [Nocardiopsis sp. JB363]